MMVIRTSSLIIEKISQIKREFFPRINQEQLANIFITTEQMGPAESKFTDRDNLELGRFFQTTGSFG